MATMQKERLLEFRGQALRNRDGDKLGKIEEIYLDAETNEPEWALVNTGLYSAPRARSCPCATPPKPRER
jgi:hypothetical protein